ncbi:uncharacterized protein LOC116304128 isoform X2 [Actinia tenebrosa]|uniref:Uncharacterized protein LOC116304128 isoform X2 n=1 Tax=Actinia tenebrosa TaxID=6105 RepID=A0A6P8IRA2_ACTTE|nr:uncharacterized protein LOC116304128 isoform X2 [Actinia tenebrosa]
MALSVVTFNIGGDGTRKQKKRMINKFFSDHLPSFIYFQENPWRKRYIRNHVPKIRERYEAVSHEQFDATVLYRKDVLKDKGSAKLRELFQDAFNDKSHLDFVTFKERASFSKLTETKTGTSFVAISWHGEYTGLSEQEKKEKFEDLLLVIKEINSKTKLPVVLGGDFNITLDSVSDSIEEQGLEVYQYDLQNRDRVIDFFVVTRDVNLPGVSAFGDYMYTKTEDQTIENEDQTSESEDQTIENEDQTSRSEDQTSRSEDQTSESEEERKQVFDHDPVQALVSFDFDKEDEDQTSVREGEYTFDGDSDGVDYYFKNISFK